jgi:hypothetical protein
MKNLTLAIDENLLHEVRKYAAEHRTTTNALAREYFEMIADKRPATKAARWAEAREQLADMARNSKADMGSGTWSRDDGNSRALKMTDR